MAATPPLAEQAEAKAEAKADADAKVATEPHALHHTKMMMGSPSVKASTAVGAGIGACAGGPVGALVGAMIGWTVERYQILGGPAGRLFRKLRGG
jgi:hypothetical protein